MFIYNDITKSLWGLRYQGKQQTIRTTKDWTWWETKHVSLKLLGSISILVLHFDIVYMTWIQNSLSISDGESTSRNFNTD